MVRRLTLFKGTSAFYEMPLLGNRVGIRVSTLKGLSSREKVRVLFSKASKIF
ncbi:unnamed protein product [Ixodes pacificus]